MLASFDPALSSVWTDDPGKGAHPHNLHSPTETAFARLHPLVKKLECFSPLSEEEKTALHSLPYRTRSMEAGQVLIEEGSSPKRALLILSGFAYRYRLLDDGRRQILGFLLLGDVCDAELCPSARADHCVTALSGSVIATVSRASLAELDAKYPNIQMARSQAALSERSILREWIMNVGQRNAIQRISHLLCELAVRMDAIGLRNDDGSIDFPLAQSTLADSIGLTTVHVNRSLKQLREDGLILISRQRIAIIDRQRLANLAGFNGDYLGLTCYREAGAQARKDFDGADCQRRAL